MVALGDGSLWAWSNFGCRRNSIDRDDVSLSPFSLVLVFYSFFPLLTICNRRLLNWFTLFSSRLSLSRANLRGPPSDVPCEAMVVVSWCKSIRRLFQDDWFGLYFSSKNQSLCALIKTDNGDLLHNNWLFLLLPSLLNNHNSNCYSVLRVWNARDSFAFNVTGGVREPHRQINEWALFVCKAIFIRLLILSLSLLKA